MKNNLTKLLSNFAKLHYPNNPIQNLFSRHVEIVCKNFPKANEKNFNDNLQLCNNKKIKIKKIPIDYKLVHNEKNQHFNCNDSSLKLN